MVNIQQFHVYSAAGAFLARKYSTNHEKYKNIKNHENSHKKCNIFSAAGAFSAKINSKKHENYEHLKKNMKITLKKSYILCRRRLFGQTMFNKS